MSSLSENGGGATSKSSWVEVGGKGNTVPMIEI